jgi:hypothetical protein
MKILKNKLVLIDRSKLRLLTFAFLISELFCDGQIWRRPQPVRRVQGRGTRLNIQTQNRHFICSCCKFVREIFVHIPIMLFSENDRFQLVAAWPIFYPYGIYISFLFSVVPVSFPLNFIWQFLSFSSEGKHNYFLINRCTLWNNINPLRGLVWRDQANKRLFFGFFQSFECDRLELFSSMNIFMLKGTGTWR